MAGRTRGVYAAGSRGGDVVEGIDEVEDVLIARWEVPAHAALLDQDAERVRAGRR